MWGAILQMIPAVVQGISAANQASQAKKLKDQYKRPTYEIPKQVKEATRLARRRYANPNLYGRQLLDDNLAGSSAQAIRAVQESGSTGNSVLGAISALNANQNATQRQLGIDSERERQNRAGLLSQALNTEGRHAERAYYENEKEPYVNAQNAAAALHNASRQNMFGAVSTGTNALIGAIGGEKTAAEKQAMAEDRALKKGMRGMGAEARPERIVAQNTVVEPDPYGPQKIVSGSDAARKAAIDHARSVILGSPAPNRDTDRQRAVDELLNELERMIDGLSEIGKAAIFDYNPPQIKDDYAQRLMAEKALRAQGEAQRMEENEGLRHPVPGMEGLFSDDYAELIEKVGSLNQLTSEYLKAGRNLVNPVSEADRQAYMDYQTLANEILQQEAIAREAFGQYDETQKLARKDPKKYDFDRFNTDHDSFFAQRDEMGSIKDRAGINLGLFEKAPVFDEAAALAEIEKALQYSQETNLINGDDWMGTKTKKFVSPESLDAKGDVLSNMPGAEKFYNEQIRTMAPEQQERLAQRARENKISPLSQYTKDVIQKHFGGIQEGGTIKNKSGSSKEIKNLAELYVSEFGKIAGGYGYHIPNFTEEFPSQGLGDIMDVMRSNSLGGLYYGNKNKKINGWDYVETKDGDAKYILNYREEETGIEKTKTKEIHPDDLWGEIIIPIVKANHGGDADKILAEMEKVYEDQFGGDVRKFDHSKVVGPDSAGLSAKEKLEAERRMQAGRAAKSRLKSAFDQMKK